MYVHVCVCVCVMWGVAPLDSRSLQCFARAGRHTRTCSVAGPWHPSLSSPTLPLPSFSGMRAAPTRSITKTTGNHHQRRPPSLSLSARSPSPLRDVHRAENGRCRQYVHRSPRRCDTPHTEDGHARPVATTCAHAGCTATHFYSLPLLLFPPHISPIRFTRNQNASVHISVCGCVCVCVCWCSSRR